jgi:hypothetical protein
VGRLRTAAVWGHGDFENLSRIPEAYLSKVLRLRIHCYESKRYVEGRSDDLHALIATWDYAHQGLRRGEVGPGSVTTLPSRSISRSPSGPHLALSMSVRGTKPCVGVFRA